MFFHIPPGVFDDLKSVILNRVLTPALHLTSRHGTYFPKSVIIHNFSVYCSVQISKELHCKAVVLVYLKRNVTVNLV